MTGGADASGLLDRVLHWELHRMAATDRNALRLGAYELLHTETPNRVAINEAVELAKRFGTAESAAFVNGILDRLLNGGIALPYTLQSGQNYIGQEARSQFALLFSKCKKTPPVENNTAPAIRKTIDRVSRLTKRSV